MASISLTDELKRWDFYLCTKPVPYGNIDYAPVDKENDDVEELIMNYLNDKTKLIRLPAGHPIDAVIKENFSLLEVKAESEFSITPSSGNPNAAAMGQQGPITSILNVIRTLDPDSDDYWHGTPRVKVIEDRLGINITAAEKDEAYELYINEQKGGNDNED